MSELVTKSVPQEQREQRIETRIAAKRIGGLTVVATTMAALAILGGAVLHALGQNKDANNDKYSLVSPGGVAFSDFRGYEDWSAASSARTEAALPDEILKVIVANPTMIKAYKAGVPGNGQPFPDGSMIVSCSGSRRRARRPPSPWMCPTSFSRLSSWRRTARDLQKAADGATRCSTMTRHRTSSAPIPKASRTADTRATRR
jgi:Cytochrome P460